MLATALLACAPAPSEQALQRFRELIVRPDVTYRFEMQVTTGRDDVRVEGMVVGRDSAYTVRPEADVAVQPPRDYVHVGDQTFERDADGQWLARDRQRRDAGFEPPQIIHVLAETPLVIAGVVTFEGRHVHQVGSTMAVPLIVGGGGSAPSTMTRVEILLDDAGLPVRVVEEIAIGAGDQRQVALVEIRFSDVGASLSVQAPVVP
jgi:hypothetical protein